MAASIQTDRNIHRGRGRATVRRFGPRGYSLLELLIALLIIQIITTFVTISVQAVNDSAHIDQINKRTIGLMRYARMLAMSSGQPCNVDFDLTNQTIKVFLGASATPASNSMFPGGVCVLNLRADQGITGVTMSNVTNSGTVVVAGNTVYRCTYGSLGTRTNAPTFAQPMTVKFTYGNVISVLTIPNAGDPN